MNTTVPGPLSILVADDEEGIRSLLMRWLGKHGHQVSCVGSGKAATRLIQQERFDLVITDVVMPDGDAFELIPVVRKTQPEARILAISGGGRYLPSGDCLSLASRLGAHATVLKPFNWEQMRSGIVQALPAFGEQCA